jgi:tRNA modification GTPase
LKRETDTIAAIATGAGGGIGIIRVSGSLSQNIAKDIFMPHLSVTALESHKLYYGKILKNNEILDEAMISLMLSPKSYTKEDVLEINCHGGEKALSLVLDLVLSKGARLAEPGEFTKRAFLNGRIDLTRAEAVMDIINARTELSHRSALGRLSGRLYEKIKECTDKVLLMLAHIEASIDYPEHDLEKMNLQEIEENASFLIEELDKLIKTSESGIALKEGIKTVILGKPNAGKSSLLNSVLKEDRSIVTDIPGTTRDIVSEYVNIKGLPLKILDTAGIRQTNDPIELAGVHKALESAKTAGLILLVLDSTEEISKEDIEILREAKDPFKIILLNKTDIGSYKLPEDTDILEGIPVVEISAKTGEGLNELYDTIYNMFIHEEIGSQTVIVESTRNRESLMNARESLFNVMESINMGMPEDILTIDLMDCYKYLTEITGEGVSEDIIDRIFSEFCLGK